MVKKIKSMKKFYIINLLLVLHIQTFAQNDTVITKQGLLLIGTIKSLSGSALMLSTSYTNDAISLKWEEVNLIKTAGLFKVMDKKGHLVIGRISMDTLHRNQFYITTGDDSVLVFKKNDIGQLSKYNPRSVRDKLDIKLDIGFITAKSNNTRQASIGIKLGYEAKKWLFAFDFNSFGSVVDTIQNSRGNIGLSAAYFLPQNWFLAVHSNFFSSTEQQLDLRGTQSIGFGKYLIRQVKHELRTYAGLNYNEEKFTKSEEQFKSSELFFNIHYFLNPVKGLDLRSDLAFNPSLTDKGRVRTYFFSEAKVTVIRHFNFGVSYTLNYDNKPPVLSEKSDYILNFKLGWSFQ